MTDRTAYAQIKNDSGVTLERVSFHHRYSDDDEQSGYSESLAPGATSEKFKVKYRTGFLRTGLDYWWCQYYLPNGSKWVSPGKLLYTLGSGDDGETLTFSVRGSRLTDPLGDAMWLHQDELPEYNSWAAVQLKNGFPVAMSAKLRHRYSDDSWYDHEFASIPPGESSDESDVAFAYFNVGYLRTGSDYWNILPKLDLVPYGNDLPLAFEEFSNSDTDKGCMMTDADNGQLLVFEVNGKGFEINLESGPCADSWKTWNGHNTLAFFQLENAFDSEVIRRGVVEHAYSDDSTWEQSTAQLAPGEKSQIMVAEYNTGFLRTGSDHWTVYVYLSNGKWYRNEDVGTSCMLDSDNATSVSILSVSDKTLSIKRASTDAKVGGTQYDTCTDPMTDKGTYDPRQGRDPEKAYDENAWIGSHNAFANFAEGFWYAQQTSSIATQLALGTTTLLLDIWYRDDDVYLIHGDHGWIQPFVANVKLSTALSDIKKFLTSPDGEVVTIVFEDKVADPHRGLIKKAFETSDTWDMVFDIKAAKVAENGWPTLSELMDQGTPLVVFTSRKSDPDFAYQWEYMTENVYGDASLDEKTWLDKRDDSSELGALPLTALNHFPSWSASDFILTQWLDRSSDDNAEPVIRKMYEACFTKCKKYPNWINADFWEVPESGGLIEAVTKLNALLKDESATSTQSGFRHGFRILTEAAPDHVQAAWNRDTDWLDAHQDRLFAGLADRVDGSTIAQQLHNTTNLALMLAVLGAAADNPVEQVAAWRSAMLGGLAGYLLSIENDVLEALAETRWRREALCSVPYLLLERQVNITTAVGDFARRRLSNSPDSPGTDGRLLSALAGNHEVAASFGDELMQFADSGRPAIARSSEAYDLTHALMYCVLTGPLPPEARALLPVFEQALPISARNPDVGAELYACYALLGGSSDTAQDALDLVATASRKRASRGVGGECECTQFREQVHERITSVLAVGVALNARES